MMNTDTAVVDSRYETNQIIVQNPDKPCPAELLSELGLMEVKYYGFDGLIHVGQIVAATKIMPEVEAFFTNAFDLKFPIERVVPVSAPEYRWDGPKVLKDNVSAGFDYRTISGEDTLSLHAHGYAFDINPKQNPYVRYEKAATIVVPKRAVWRPERPGTLHAEHPLVKLMEGFGWEWGGHWTKTTGRTDYMHFQKEF